MNKNDNYLNFPALSYFFEKLKTFFATKNELNNIKGEKGDKGDPGIQGVSVTKIEQTSASTTDSGINTITVTLSDGTTSTFNIKNGSKGSTGLKGDTGAKGDKGDTGAKGATGSTGTRGSRWNTGTAITGTSTTATVFTGSGITDALVNDMYLNTSTGYVYKCATAGAASVAKWVYVGSIKGATGTNATTTAVATTYANGLMSKEMVQKLGAIDGITSDINSESNTIAASSKMVHDLNSNLSDLFKIENIKQNFTMSAYGEAAITVNPLPVHNGYNIIGVVSFSTNVPSVYFVGITVGSNLYAYIKNIHSAQVSGTASFNILYIKNL